jgi:hypothetical protein
MGFGIQAPKELYMCPTLIWSTPSIELYNHTRRGKVEAPQTVKVSNLAGETLCFILHLFFGHLQDD